MLSDTNSMSKIKGILNSYDAYLFDTETLFETSIGVTAEEVKYELHDIITKAQYDTIKAISYADYSSTQRKVYFAEVYLVAASFLHLQAWKEDEDRSAEDSINVEGYSRDKSGPNKKHHLAFTYRNIGYGYLIDAGYDIPVL